MRPGHLTGPRLVAQPDAVRDRIAGCLRGFSSPSSDPASLSEPAYRVSVPWGDPLDPWAIRFLIVDVIGGVDVGRAEKQAWAAPIEMDGTVLWFAHTKFGVSASAYGVESDKAASRLVADCMKRMRKAFPVVRRDLISPLIDEAVAQGAFTVPNKFEYFLAMFSHLRSLSEATASRAKVAKPVTDAFPGGSSMRFAAAELAREAEFEAVGALFAFFSLLEHLLVIGLAFVDYDPADEPFGEFLRLNWGEKFKRVVGLGGKEDKEDKAIYDTLRSLADENRNPAAHGGVDRNITNVHVHLAGYGAVSTGATADSTRPQYTFEPQLPRSVHPFADYHFFGGSQDGWDAIDRILAWMKSGPLSNAFTYGESQLPVWFDRQSRQDMRDAAAANDLDSFIDRRGYLMDEASNMDWG